MGRGVIGSALLAGMVVAAAGIAAGQHQPAGPVAKAPIPTDPAAYRQPAEGIPFPADNPYSRAKHELGERLFHDPRLSGGDTMSCASCHDPSLGFGDGKVLAVGEKGQQAPRHTPTLWNLAWAPTLFWDGRAPSLEAQATGPIANPVEMAQDLAALPAELAADPEYPAQFAAAFPEAPGVTLDNLAKALATFERTLVSPETPFDRWAAGDETAVPEAAKRGFALFTGKAQCAACHSGWAFTDHAFYDIGLPGTGPGRGGVLGQPRLENAWKTPTLREVGRHAPYMHDGSLATLEAVIDHYAGREVERPTLAPELPRKLVLSAQEKADLLAFLKTLDSDRPQDTAPVLAALTLPAPKGHDHGPKAQDRVEVTQRDKAFSAKSVALKPGGTLVIHNDDSRAHNIRVFAPSMDYDSGLQDPGQSVSVPFKAPGEYTAVCNIHPTMRLKVTVGPDKGAHPGH